MITGIELSNFKSFSHISIDLRNSRGVPKKAVFIYGENGSGKSNLVSSVDFLSKTFYTLDFRNFYDDPALSSGPFKLSENKKKSLTSTQRIISERFFILGNLIKEYRMIGTTEPMRLKLSFRINGFDGSYTTEYSENAIIKEELRYRIVEREGLLFSINKEQVTLSPSIFKDTKYTQELKDNIVKYWGKHTFMSVLFNEYLLKNEDYVSKNLGQNIVDVITWFKNISVFYKGYNTQTVRLSIPVGFMEHLNKGAVKEQNDKELKVCEEALNIFFTGLYADIKLVRYVVTPGENGYDYELFFTKLIDGEKIDVPVSLESTGTQKLLELFPAIFASMVGGTVFIDEIDSGIHDLLMKNLLNQLVQSLEEGQFIATTHNTSLMESFPAESIYIIRVDANGNKSIDCITDYKERTQQNNNVRRKYLRGDYDGIPNTGYLDLQELAHDVLLKLPFPQ